MSMPRYYRDEDDNEKSGHKFRRFGINRYICDVLEEMRSLVKNENYKPLAGLIEEAQSLANRMEAGLSDKRDLLALSDARAKAKKAYRELEREYRALEEKVKSKKAKLKKNS